jgi:ABC-type dipeptide/oligopeptide/nickel transport system permease subunit
MAVDFLLALPWLPFLLLLTTARSGVFGIALVVAPTAGYLLRTELLDSDGRRRVDGSRMGRPRRIDGIAFADLVLPLALANAILAAALGVLVHAALGFLGVTGADEVSWGELIGNSWENLDAFAGRFWMFSAPGLLLSVLAVGLAVLGLAILEEVVRKPEAIPRNDWPEAVAALVVHPDPLAGSNGSNKNV